MSKKINELYDMLSVRSINYLEKLGYKYLHEVDLQKVNNSNIINYGMKTKQEINNFINNL